jgi:hypothetical protein
MSRIVDNLIAMKIVRMITQNFEDTEAFKLGIIDHQGNNLRKMSTLSTEEERNAYSYLNRLVFNMKKILNRLPGGENRMKSLVGALWLVKEYYESGSRTTSLMEDRYKHIMRIIESSVVLAEEQIIVNRVLSEDGEGGAPTNNTGGPVSVQEPKIEKKNVKKYQIMARRGAPVKA